MLINKLSSGNVIFIGCLIIFCLLLFKDVFSERTLIPNFEPFPDAFHYVIPARNIVKGEGFVISREGKVLQSSSVGPLYSFSLIPIFIINNDPRMFYFTNIIIAVLSFSLFYKIIFKISQSHWIIFIALFLYSTNYYLYWYPTLAMAENLMILLFLGAVYLVLLPVKPINLLIAAVIALSFYLTKYANAPLTPIYICIYGLKIFISKKEKRYFLTYIALISFMMILAAVYLYFSKNINIFLFFLYYVKGTLLFQSKDGQVFFTGYVFLNLPKYIEALLGFPTKVLWDTTPLVPKLVGVLGLVGLLVGIVKSNTRYLSLSLVILLFGSVLFMSTFYSFDSRYILYVIPILLIGFTILLTYLLQLFSKFGFSKLYYLILFLFIAWYVFTNVLRIKNQIMLNVKHAETPWYYVSILEMNKYFTSDKIQGNRKPILISAMAPYLVDFFSNNNFTLLPLSYDQEFRSAKELVWGPNDYSDLPKLYTKYIKEGYPVYVDRYGLGNENYTNRDYKVIENSFNLTKVQTGCFEQCNIYKLDLKNDN